VKELLGDGAAAGGALGLVHQALVSAVTDGELSEYFRMLAMLQSLAMHTPDSSSDAYLTLPRLEVWLEDPAQRMRLLKQLLLSCQGLKARTPHLSPCVRGCGAAATACTHAGRPDRDSGVRLDEARVQV
jgi:Gamma tubulin complex component N-terminal